MQILESSFKIAETQKNLNDLCEIIKSLQIGQSVAVPIHLMSYETVGSVCNVFSELEQEKMFVYFKHETSYEIACIDKKIENKLFQSLLNGIISKGKNKKVESSTEEADRENLLKCRDKIFQFIVKYLKSDLESVRKIHSNVTFEMFQDRVVTYAYLQRNSSSVACFKNYSKGSSEALKTVLNDLANNGNIEYIPKHEMYKYDCTITAYRIIHIE